MMLKSIPAPGGARRCARIVVPAAATLLVLAGCAAAPGTVETQNAPLHDDVVDIKAFIRPKPWLNFDPRHPARVNGIAINMYLISGSLQKGVFGAGTIRVVLYEDKPAAEASDSGMGRELHKWELTPEQAMPYRVVRRPDRTYVMGDGYQLRLSWGDAELAERRVKLRIEYQRTDGRIVGRRPFHLQIPKDA